MSLTDTPDDPAPFVRAGKSSWATGAPLGSIKLEFEELEHYIVLAPHEIEMMREASRRRQGITKEDKLTDMEIAELREEIVRLKSELKNIRR